MSRPDPRRQELHDTIRSTLTLLNARLADRPKRDLPAQALPSLLERCRQMTEDTARRGPPPVRLVHHLACTGGTLISRCLAALPNVRLLSEVDPLSQINEKVMFVPTDIVRLSRKASRPVSSEVETQIFRAGLEVVRQDCRNLGLDLVLRDHSHGAFDFGSYRPDRPTLREMLQDHMPLRSLVTVRHPLDSFLSLVKMGWDKHFVPATLDEYARRYHLFLDRHDAFDMLRYEDFLEDPRAHLRQACATLDLTYSDGFTELFQAFTLSGDSGRSSGRIGARPRQPIPDQMEDQRQKSENYAKLCARLGYEG
ncbi:sulfotransferase [Pseudotabrizicola sp. 4114]|uniref:sulfotransferase n=1 Tax=Pseudotabrizicola sp. 4114 TaxID=2817731 RepID=UPI00286403A3|nr:hypothetical protein [Pseudorhodobacter sp. 4114]